MQISIDTTKDTHEDIRKAIALLQSIILGGEVRTNAPSGNIFENPTPETQSANLMGMFDDAAPAPRTPSSSEVIDEAKPAENAPSDVELY